VWNSLDYLAYREHRPRFVAEFGWQGPPAWATLRRALSDDPLTPESPGMLVHQKAADGNTKLTVGLLPHFRLPSTMEDWHWAMSLNQARAISTGVEYFRSLSPHCAGTIVWQLNDCWPVVSWSAIDGDGRRKPMFYALAHAHAARLVTVQPALDGIGLRVALVNDTASPWSGLLAVSRRTFDGVEVAKASVDVTVAAWSTVDVRVPALVGMPEDAGRELIVVSLDDRRGLWWFAEDRDSALPPASFSGVVVAVEGGYRVTVTADVLLRDLSLLVDRVDPDAVVDDMLVTLLPGESVTWQVRCPSTIEPSSFLDPLVLRSANQLVSTARRAE
jgi:beta-mannosidase